MKKADEYRKHAKECRDLAAQMDKPEQSEQLMLMADAWEAMAADREILVQRIQGPSVTEAGS